MKEPSADIGLVGLAVMGENLVLNMESHGYTVAVYNRTRARVDDFLAGRYPPLGAILDDGFDLRTNPSHCGMCNNACMAGQSCQFGMCQPMCQFGATNCSDGRRAASHAIAPAKSRPRRLTSPTRLPGSTATVCPGPSPSCRRAAP